MGFQSVKLRSCQVNINWYFSAVFLLICFFSVGANGQDVGFSSQAGPPRIKVVKGLRLDDLSGRLTFEQVLLRDTLLPFVPYTSDNAFFEAGSPSWLRIVYQSEPPGAPFVLFTNTLVDTMEVYVPDNSGDYRLKVSGIKSPYARWPLQINQHAFLIESANGYPVYIRVRPYADTGLGVTPKSVEMFMLELKQKNLYFGAFLGFACVALVFAIAFFLRMRDYAFLFYAIYVGALAIFAAVNWGLILHLVVTWGIRWSPDLYTVPFALMTVGLLLYSRKMLSTEAFLPVFDRLLSGAAILRIIIYFAGLAFDLSVLYTPQIDSFLLLIPLLAGIVRVRQGFRPAAWFTVGFSFLLLGFLIHSLTNQGFIKFSNLPARSIFHSGVIEMVFFALALADRFWLLQKENLLNRDRAIRAMKENEQLSRNLIDRLEEQKQWQEQLNRELEEKVRIRTAELEAANEEIQRMNLLLYSDNEKLRERLELSHKARIMHENVTFDEFRRLFPDPQACYAFIARLKSLRPFACRKCGNPRYSEGPDSYSRRCSRCNYIEHVAVGTLFSQVRFPIEKAFYLLFLIWRNPEITIDQLAEAVDLRRQTAWLFRGKVLARLAGQKKRRRNEQGWVGLILAEKNDA